MAIVVWTPRRCSMPDAQAEIARRIIAEIKGGESNSTLPAFLKFLAERQESGGVHLPSPVMASITLARATRLQELLAEFDAAADTQVPEAGHGRE